MFAAACIAAAIFSSSGVARAGVIAGPGTVRVAIDGAHVPIPFSVDASGFPPGDGSVFVEQCDGVPPSDPSWSPTRDCDSASSPAAASVGADGVVHFPARDPNFGLSPFAGKSPQGLFNCLAPGDALNNGKRTFSNCQLRVATSLTAATADQAFVALVFPPGASGMAAETNPTTSAASSRTSAPAVAAAGSKAQPRRSTPKHGASNAAVATRPADRNADKSLATKVRDALFSLPGFVLLAVVVWLAFEFARRSRRRRSPVRVSATGAGSGNPGEQSMNGPRTQSKTHA